MDQFWTSALIIFAPAGDTARFHAARSTSMSGDGLVGVHLHALGKFMPGWTPGNIPRLAPPQDDTAEAASLKSSEGKQKSFFTKLARQSTAFIRAATRHWYPDAGAATQDITGNSPNQMQLFTKMFQMTQQGASQQATAAAAAAGGFIHDQHRYEEVRQGRIPSQHMFTLVLKHAPVQIVLKHIVEDMKKSPQNREFKLAVDQLFFVQKNPDLVKMLMTGIPPGYENAGLFAVTLFNLHRVLLTYVREELTNLQHKLNFPNQETWILQVLRVDEAFIAGPPSRCLFGVYARTFKRIPITNHAAVMALMRARWRMLRIVLPGVFTDDLLLFAETVMQNILERAHPDAWGAVLVLVYEAGLAAWCGALKMWRLDACMDTPPPDYLPYIDLVNPTEKNPAQSTGIPALLELVRRVRLGDYIQITSDGTEVEAMDVVRTVTDELVGIEQEVDKETPHPQPKASSQSKDIRDKCNRKSNQIWSAYCKGNDLPPYCGIDAARAAGHKAIRACSQCGCVRAHPHQTDFTDESKVYTAPDSGIPALTEPALKMAKETFQYITDGAASFKSHSGGGGGGGGQGGRKGGKNRGRGKGRAKGGRIGSRRNPAGNKRKRAPPAL